MAGLFLDFIPPCQRPTRAVFSRWGFDKEGKVLTVHRKIIRLLLASALPLLASPAMACSDLPNICAMQAQQWQEQNDYFATPPADDYYEDEDYYTSDYDDNYYPIYTPDRPVFNPMQQKLDTAFGMFSKAADLGTHDERLRDDPRYRAYMQGEWEYFENNATGAEGSFCVAMFWSKDGFITLSGPGEGYDGALITFMGTGIPRPVEVSKVPVTLDQTDSPSATVTAFNFTPPGTKIGAVALAVPSLDAMLDGMLDTHDFTVIMEGKPVFSMGWHGGLAAVEQLKSCAAKRQ